MKIFKILSGVILVLAGVFCFANPGATFISVAFLIGCSMMISGITGTMAYIWLSRKKDTPNRIFVEGIFTIILGCLVLSNQLITDAIIPVFFGMWVLFSGALCVSDSYIMKKSGKSLWYGVLILGVLDIFVGLYAFFNPVLAALSVVMQVGIFFVMQGVNVLAVGFHLPHLKRHSHGVYQKSREVKA